MKDLRDELNKLHGLQWHKKYQLRNYIEKLAAIHSNIMSGDGLVVTMYGRTSRYVSMEDVKLMNYYQRQVSRLQKEVNENKARIRDHLQFIQIYVYTHKKSGAI